MPIAIALQREWGPSALVQGHQSPEQGRPRSYNQPPCPGGRQLSKPGACIPAQRGRHCLRHCVFRVLSAPLMLLHAFRTVALNLDLYNKNKKLSMPSSQFFFGCPRHYENVFCSKWNVVHTCDCRYLLCGNGRAV